MCAPPPLVCMAEVATLRQRSVPKCRCKPEEVTPGIHAVSALSEWSLGAQGHLSQDMHGCLHASMLRVKSMEQQNRAALRKKLARARAAFEVRRLRPPHRPTRPQDDWDACSTLHTAVCHWLWPTPQPMRHTIHSKSHQ